MRKVDLHIIHCADTPNDMDIGVKEIDMWHKERGWSGCGYHFVIRRNGVIEFGRPIEIVGAHCKGKNSNSIGTCLIGRDYFTEKQYKSLRLIDDYIKNVYNREIKTFGHCDFSSKSCPNFDVKKVIGI